MKVKRLNVALWGSMLFLAACSDKNGSDPAPEPGGNEKSKYVFVAYSVGSEGIESAPYIITADSVTGGKVNLSAGVETDAYSFITQNNKIFAAVWSQQGPVTPYGLDANGKVVQSGSTINASIAAIYNTVNDNEWIGGGMTGSRESPNAPLFRFDAKDPKIAGRNTIDLSKVVTNDEWPTWYGVFQVDQDRLYIPYDTSPSESGATTKYRDSTWVMVVSYPGLEFKKVIKDGRSGPIGSWFGMHGLKQFDDGDVYGWSTAYASKNPSAILRIKKGTDEFDQTYFFNVEEKTGGLKLGRGDYLGGDKLLISVYTSAAQAGEWNGRTRMAIADVKAQTITWIQGIPEHPQMSYKQKIYLENDKKTAHYVMKDDRGEIAVYNIDIATAQAKKGLVFENVADITTISKLKY